MQILYFSALTALLLSASSCNAQQAKQVVPNCESCEAIFESPQPFNTLNSIDTLPDFTEEGPKLEISGTVYHTDGTTPAGGVVVYIYHTDQKGKYSGGGRHGYCRGWVKTDNQGRYRFLTLKPASYPGGGNPAHIHVLIKEPCREVYWVDDFHFEGDPYLTAAQRNDKARGGSGLVRLQQKDGRLYARRDIVLGKNMADYGKPKVSLQSGIPLGTYLPPFDPVHLTGKDAGTRRCPMCTYGYGQGVVLWFKPEDRQKMTAFAGELEKAMQQRGAGRIRVFLVSMLTQSGMAVEKKLLEQWAQSVGLKQVALLWLPPEAYREASRHYRINPETRNTVFVYHKRKLTQKWVDIDFGKPALEALLKNL